LKDCEPNELNWALNEVMEKGYHYTKKVNGLLKVAKKPRAKSKDKKTKDLLKESELNFIKLACSDLTYKEIADHMKLSPKTIDGYRQDVFTKLEVKNRVGMVLYAVKHKIIDL
jgi:DNA-binding NarL/FixJ family response regulator